ncbi:thioredoxin domain-containing protein 12-like isoform X2 [Zootermopsis nevadensis]|uniref:thioredoxin domain-containing protein 12-like isoform X2 n=1 Tax=Zootermopsis nevadensis TaxID=136037 RepID=UPI000B8E7270|nr:thioredoxin domain-containing protein 12-like isoform X2 [Zootermopsis nevadensis]
MLLTFNYNWFIGSFFIAIVTASSQNSGRGFGEQYNWFSLKEGLERARNNNKPLMLIIHKTWCGACKALKSQFSASKEIEVLSSHFVMVNAEDDEEPKDEQYFPDGGYVPRILFVVTSEVLSTSTFRQFWDLQDQETSEKGGGKNPQLGCTAKKKQQLM